MAYSRSSIYERRAMEQKELLKRLASLAVPTRLEIVSILSEKGELCVCELLKRLSISLEVRWSAYSKRVPHRPDRTSKPQRESRDIDGKAE
jgi:DNA-binding transcriptional ArsR family regulator